MRTLKVLRKRKPTFTVAKWLVRFYGLFHLLPANEVEVAFVEDLVSDMPDDERFRKFAVVENHLDAGCDFPPILWAESPDLNPATTNGCESYHAHLNAEFYAQLNQASFILFLDLDCLFYMHTGMCAFVTTCLCAFIRLLCEFSSVKKHAVCAFIIRPKVCTPFLLLRSLSLIANLYRLDWRFRNICRSLLTLHVIATKQYWLRLIRNVKNDPIAYKFI